MNAYLNITIRVQSQQALAQARQMQNAVKGIVNAGQTGSRGFGPLDKIFSNTSKIFTASSAMEKFGKNLQWTGRQLEYNFTLPLLLAGGAATKWALDNDKAMTRVRMVYGSATDDQQMLRQETDALAKSFEILSNRFGVQQSKVIEIGSAWAEAGVAGRGLAEATQLTLETMAIGAIDQEKAMTGLMAIQSAYKLNTAQLRDAVALLSGVNKTGTISFAGLIDVVQRAGSVARASGIDIQHLAAMANILTPAAGSASQAGNALRTMISRLSAPTKDTVDVLNAMGIAVESFDWQASDGVKRIKTLATSFAGLSTAQKNLVASVVASRWQINRFDLLMEDVNSTTGAYAKALRETADPAKNMQVYAGMLTKYFSSTNIAFKVLTTQIQNALARAILPLLPALVALLERAVSLFTWFSNLSPQVQQFALMALVALAAVGPLAKYLGALSTLGGLLGKVFGFLVVLTSRHAAASIIDAAANEVNAGSIDAMALSAARARVKLTEMFTTLWSIATLPFRAIGGLMSLMWTGYVKGTELAFKATGFVLRAIMGLLPGMKQIGTAITWVWNMIAAAVGPAMAAMAEAVATVWRTLPMLAGIIGQGIVIAWQAASEAALAAWIAVTEALPVIWRTLPAIAGIISQAVAYAWQAAPELALAAWIAVTEALPVIWRTLPALAGIIGQGIVLAWQAAGDVALAAWIAVTEAIPVIWRTLPAIAGIVGQGIGIAMEKAAVWAQATWYLFTQTLAALWASLVPILSVIVAPLTAAWAAAASAATAVWEFFTVTVPALWAALPSFASMIGTAVSFAWEASAALATAGWAFFTETLPILWAALPMIAAEVSSLILAALTSPYTLIVAAVIAFAIIFRKQLGAAVQWVMDLFNKLPEGIVGVFRRIISIIQEGVKIIARLISSINPFDNSNTRKAAEPIRRAAGGPVPGIGDSDSVLALLTPGEFVINKKAASLLGPEVLKRLNKYAAGGQVAPTPALSAFNKATAGGQAQIDAAETAKLRSDVLSFSPNAGPAFDALVASIKDLKVKLDAANASYLAQEKIVQDVQTWTDALNASLDAERNKLDDLKNAQSAVKDELDAAKDTLQQLAHTDISGMRAMGNQIFDNEMAQKKLRLEIMKMEDAAGGSIDEMRNKLALLQGDLETMTGERNDLRLAGAGSDILQTYDDQIAAIKDQQKATEDLVKPISDAQKALEALQRTGEELDLQNSITFDPQLRQIQQMVDGLNEMPFDQIIAGIQTQQGLVADLTVKYDAATKAVKDQEAVVQSIEHERDKSQAILEAEKNKLDAIKDSYDQIEQSIRDSEAAMNDFATAAAKAKSDTSLNQDLFAAGEGANFDIPGGTSTLGREGGLADINAFNDEQQKALEDQMKQLGHIDMLKPFKDMWNTSWKWLKDNVGPVVGPVFDQVKTTVKGWVQQISGEVDFGGIFDSLKHADASTLLSTVGDAWTKLGKQVQDTPLGTTFNNLTDTLKMGLGVLKFVFDWMVTNVGPVLKMFAGWFVDAGKQLWNEVKKWAPLFDPFIEALGHVYAVISWFVKVAYAVLSAGIIAVIAVMAVLWPIIKNIVKPVFDFIVGVIIAAMEVIRGVIEVVLGLINGDWSLVWNGILAIFEGVWDAIYAVVSTVFGLIYGVIKGIIESIVHIFQWLYDVLIGHSIVPDLVNGILFLFQALFDGVKFIFTAIGAAIKFVWDNVIMPIWRAFQWVWDTLLWPLLQAELRGFTAVFNAIGAALKWSWDNLIQPVWNLFTSVWTNVLQPAMNALKDGFAAIWHGIGDSLRWVWDNVLKPVWDLLVGVWNNVLKPAMDALAKGFKSVWDGVADSIRSAINLGIKGINFLIRGINKIVDLVPGLDFKLSEITEIPVRAQGGTVPTRAGQLMASGGRIDPTAARVGSGMITNRPRAIVGEGNPLYPEYVVPTDPRYRNRALDLWRALGNDLGTVSDGARGMARAAETGGFIDSMKDKLGGVIGAIRRGAVTAAFAPFLKLFDTAVAPIPSPFQDMLKGFKNKVYNWAKGVDDNLPEADAAGHADVPGEGYQAIIDWLGSHMSKTLFRVTSTLRSGDTGSYHSVGRAADFAGPSPGRDTPSLLAINKAFLPIAGTLKELIYAGPGGQSYKDGALHNYSKTVMDDHHDHVHAALRAGGRLLVGRRPGGTLLRVGEGRWNEEVQVKPIQRDSLNSGDTHNHFYGDLSFPNVRDGEDAEEFIRNLEDIL